MNCDRYGISQVNLAGNTEVLTFSIRRQLKDLLDTGDFDDVIFVCRLKFMLEIYYRTCSEWKMLRTIFDC